MIVLSVFLLVHTLAASASWNLKAPIPPMQGNAVVALKGKLYALPLWNTSKIAPHLQEFSPAENVWRTKAALPVAKHDFVMVALGDRIYTIGGRTADGADTASVEEYDPVTDRWRARASAPTARHNMSSSVLSGRVWVLGGAEQDKAVGATEAYDPVSDRWETFPAMPTPRVYGSAAATVTEIHVLGGVNGSREQPVLETFDTVSGKWGPTLKPPLEQVHGITAVVNGKVYVISYHGPERASGHNVHEYDPATGRWTVKADMPAPRGDVGCVVVDKQIYIIAGFRDGGPPHRLSPAVERYDPASDRWTALPSLSRPKWQIAVATLGGRIYVVGGMYTKGLEPNRYEDRVEEFTP